MKFLHSFKTIVYPACFYFTIVTFLLSIIGTLAEQTAILPTLSSLTLFFIFSLFMAVMNKIFSLKQLNLVLKITIHFVGTFVSFWIVFIYFSGFYKNSGTGIIISAAFIVLYFIVLLLVMGVQSSIKRKKTERAAYNSQFKKSK